jgi:Tfp pilus assembly protein FimV
MMVDSAGWLGVTPRLLGRASGRWVLEVERLLPIRPGDPRILRPTKERVEGEERILGLLKKSAATRLCDAASELIRGTPAGSEPQCYRPSDGGWVVAEGRISLPPRPGNDVEPTAPAPHESAAAKAEVATLEAANRALRERVERLERRADAAAAQLQALAAELAALRTQGVAPAPRSVPPVAAPPSSPPRAAVPSRDSVPNPVITELEPAAPAPAVDERVSLKLGPGRPLAVAMGTLTGGHATIREAKKSTAALSTLQGVYASILVDDEGNKVGAMVADLRATVVIGAALMMLPQGEVQAQIKAGEPSDDVLECMSEVFNTLSGTINQIAGNLHVKTTPAKVCDAETLDWLSHPSSRLDLEETTGGRLVLLAL